MYNERTKVREIINLPGVLEIVERHTGHKMNMQTLKMGANFTIQTVGQYLKWTRSQMQSALRDLNEAAEKMRQEVSKKNK